MKNRFLLLVIVLTLVLGLLSACAASGSVDRGQGGAAAPTGGTAQGGNGGSEPAGAAGGADQGINGGDSLAGAANTSSGDTITQEQAQQIALEHVNLTADQVSGMRVRYDRDDGVPEYDVEFYYDGLEYEFEIHAETGKILSFEKDN